MSGYKPTDFFIGLIDFFAVLLPGAILVFLLVPWLGPLFGSFLPPLTTPLEQWVVFLTGSYVAGHILHQMGDLLLDRFLYDEIYVKIKRRSGEERLLSRTKELMGRASELTNAYSWAGSFVRTTSAAAAAEVERAGAESKFFRSLSLVLIVAAILAAAQGKPGVVGGSLVLAVFAGWRFCDRRWKAVQMTYEYYVLLIDPTVQSTGGRSPRAVQ